MIAVNQICYLVVGGMARGTDQFSIVILRGVIADGNPSVDV